MRKIIITAAFVTISSICVTSVLAQTMPNRNQPPKPPANANQITQIPQMQQPAPKVQQQGLQERPGTNSGIMPNKTLNNGQGSQSGNLQQKCLTVENVISDQAQKGTDMLIKIYQQLNSIFTGVQNYYTQKLVPNGVSLQNYSTLVNNVEASQSAVLAQIQAAQKEENNFSCQTSEPGQQVAQFRNTMQIAIKATIAYRDAIKNFVEDVLKAAQNVTETANTTATNSAQ